MTMAKMIMMMTNDLAMEKKVSLTTTTMRMMMGTVQAS
jgi:hypothetical protein